MFGVSLPELLLVLVVVLIVFGPERLGDIARTIGKISGSLRKSSDALRREFYNSVYTPADDIKAGLGGATDDLRAIGSEVAGDFEATLTEVKPIIKDLPEHLLTTCEEQAKLEKEEEEKKRAAAEEAQSTGEEE